MQKLRATFIASSECRRSHTPTLADILRSQVKEGKPPYIQSFLVSDMGIRSQASLRSLLATLRNLSKVSVRVDSLSRLFTFLCFSRKKHHSLFLHLIGKKKHLRGAQGNA